MRFHIGFTVVGRLWLMSIGRLEICGIGLRRVGVALAAVALFGCAGGLAIIEQPEAGLKITVGHVSGFRRGCYLMTAEKAGAAIAYAAEDRSASGDFLAAGVAGAGAAAGQTGAIASAGGSVISDIAKAIAGDTVDDACFRHDVSPPTSGAKVPEESEDTPDPTPAADPVE